MTVELGPIEQIKNVDVGAKAETVGRSVQDVGMGKVGRNSHPAHPIFVHYPIAFYMSAFTLDIVSYGLSSAPKLSSTIATALGTSSPALFQGIHLITKASYAAGLVTTVPAVATGLIEFYAMYKANGFDMQNPKISKTVYHAALNTVAATASAWLLLDHWRKPSGTPASGGKALLALSMIAGTGLSAYLGGSLVYEHGVGVQRQGDGAAYKRQELESAKNEVRKNE